MSGRRSNGEGSIRQLPSGLWRAQIMDGYKSDGKRNIVSFTSISEVEAIEKMKKYKADRAAGLMYQSSCPFSDWAQTWYEYYRDQVQPSTYSNYKYTLKILKNNFGKTEINKILPLDIKQVLLKIAAEGYSASQLSKCRCMLIQIFDEAESNLIIPFNPARKIKPLKTAKLIDLTQNGKDSFTADELEILFLKLPHNLLGHSIRILLLTGMRLQELMALKSTDIAIDGSEIVISKASKTVDGKAYLGLPKTNRSSRKIPVPPEGQTYARYLRQNSMGQFIWTSSVKNPLYSLSSFRRKYYIEIAKLEGVRRLPPHCCRHTYITTLQAKGVSMETIARLVGHSRITTTDGYLHIAGETLIDAVKNLKCSNYKSTNYLSIQHEFNTEPNELPY